MSAPTLEAVTAEQVRSAIDPIDGPGFRQRLRANLPILALVAWTWFVWVGRVRNIAADDSLTGFSMAWRLGMALTFVLSAALAFAAIVARPAAIQATSRFLAVFGIVVWAIRGTDIALGDHSAAFIAVHTVLAVVTIALGAWVLRRKAGNRRGAVSSIGDG